MFSTAGVPSVFLQLAVVTPEILPPTLFRFEISCGYRGGELSLNRVTNSLTPVVGPSLVNRELTSTRSPLKSPQISDDEAHVIGLKALAFVASEPTRLGRFLALTGIGPERLREVAASPDFLTGVLTHLLEDESMLVVFAAEHDLDPRLPALAAKMLSGQRST
jgi:hypothetical protein